MLNVIVLKEIYIPKGDQQVCSDISETIFPLVGTGKNYPIYVDKLFPSKSHTWIAF